MQRHYYQIWHDCIDRGPGMADTDVSNSPEGTITGGSIDNYFGNPVIKSYISGSGKIFNQQQNIGSIFVEFFKPGI
jgi:hypothetical protein